MEQSFASGFLLLRETRKHMFLINDQGKPGASFVILIGAQ